MRDERIGAVIAGRYRLERVIGRGGMGTVYGALHAWTQRRVAVKLLRKETASGAAATARFLREARAASRIKHPNVVDVLDMGQDEVSGEIYLVFELLEGVPLDDHLALEGRLSTYDTLEITVPVMDAVAAAHREGIVHRDLKPDNVFLSVDPKGHRVPKILDFGVSKLLGDGSAKLTRTGVILGTPEYMSPEQMRGERELTPATDVWSMGVLLYECLTGALPFDGPTPGEVMTRVLHGPSIRLAPAAPDVPEPVARVVERALSRSAGDRQPDMGALLADLVTAAQRCGVLSGAASRLVVTQMSLSSRPGPIAPPTAAATPARDRGEPSRAARLPAQREAPLTVSSEPLSLEAPATPPTVRPGPSDPARPTTTAEADALPVARGPLVVAALLGLSVVTGGAALGVYFWARAVPDARWPEPRPFPTAASAPTTTAAPGAVPELAPDPDPDPDPVGARAPGADGSAEPGGSDATGDRAAAVAAARADAGPGDQAARAAEATDGGAALSERELRLKALRKARRAQRRAERAAKAGGG